MIKKEENFHLYILIIVFTIQQSVANSLVDKWSVHMSGEKFHSKTTLLLSLKLVAR